MPNTWKSPAKSTVHDLIKWLARQAPEVRRERLEFLRWYLPKLYIQARERLRSFPWPQAPPFSDSD